MSSENKKITPKNVSPTKDGFVRVITQGALYYMDEKRFLKYVKGLVEIKKGSRTKKEVHGIVRPEPGLF